MTTAITATKKFQAMPLNRKAHQLLDTGNLLLAQTRVYLHHFSTIGAGNMVMVMSRLLTEAKTM
jgi:hypothetical protein